MTCTFSWTFIKNNRTRSKGIKITRNCQIPQNYAIKLLLWYKKSLSVLCWVLSLSRLNKFRLNFDIDLSSRFYRSANFNTMPLRYEKIDIKEGKWQFQANLSAIFLYAHENCIGTRFVYSMSILRCHRKVWNSYSARDADSFAVFSAWIRMLLIKKVIRKKYYVSGNRNESRTPSWSMGDYAVEMESSQIAIAPNILSLKYLSVLIRSSLIM